MMLTPPRPSVANARIWFCFAVLVFCTQLPLAAQEEDEEQPFRPGLVGLYQAGRARAERVDDAIRFAWGSHSPDARIPHGKFSATWRGILLVPSRGEYRFFLHGAGEVELKLGGEVLIGQTSLDRSWAESKPLQLPAEDVPIEVSFSSKGADSSVALYWEGPQFVREPIPPRFFQHDRNESPSSQFERGEALAKALRCSACHLDDADLAHSPAPALDRLAGNIEPQWIVDWLQSAGEADSAEAAGASHSAERKVGNRRMPHFGMSKKDATAIAAWLVSLPKLDLEPAESPNPRAEKSAADKPKGKADKAEQPSVASGERLALTLGCLACHQIGKLGQSGLFGGGDLTMIADKRPVHFFDLWLSDPARLNSDHRMPVFQLTDVERRSLALFLQEQRSAGSPEDAGKDRDTALKLPNDAETIARGKQAFLDFNCHACHRWPQEPEEPEELVALQDLLHHGTDWSDSCLATPRVADRQPGYQLSKEDAAAVRHYFTERSIISQPASDRWMLVEQNCLACHTREGMSPLSSVLPPPLADKLTAVAEVHQDLSTRVPSLTPPSLNSVGDKLHDAALAAAIRRVGPPHRDYLQVRMPKFRLSDEQLQSLVGQLISADRIPAYEAPHRVGEATTQQPPALHAAGSRLVTTDGFGCTSCHAVGGIPPSNAPANARGPELAGMHERIRREWYDRWVRNPARIVPRMEMPSVQLPVRGVLHDDINQQLAAVWHVLATPGFKPPEPNPVRVLRRSGDPQKNEPAITLNDVVKSGDKTWLFPLVVGLPNRHNVMFDLEHNRLARWWIGDMARQRTKGKTWFWEQGGTTVFDPQIEGSELSLIVDGKEVFPEPRNQFLADLQSYGSFDEGRGITFLTFLPTEFDNDKEQPQCWCEQFFRLPEPAPAGPARQWQRVVSVYTPQRAGVKLRLVGAGLAKKARWNADAKTLHIPGIATIRVEQPAVQWHPDGTISFTPEERSKKGPSDSAAGTPDVSFVLHYSSDLTADQYLVEAPPEVALEATDVTIAPGFSGRRLPLPAEITPTGLAWRDGGELVFSTLKGEVFSAWDSNSDGLVENLRLLADGLATPYGVQTGVDSVPYIDIATKAALLRLKWDYENLSSANRIDVVAAGWGYTDDYHDWVVGLPRAYGRVYYLGIPCQQDNRSAAAAKHRGEIVKLVPRTSNGQWRKFDIETITRGHRFPMGLALRKDGELFVTDNQGNYNPFNELNHVTPGDHFGFINAIEKKDPKKAAAAAAQPLKEPAVNIPHPWTRSVNGICFLETPNDVRKKTGRDAFGPFEGHIVGCEYDTRRLIRMSIDEVGGVFQGAAYPLSVDAPVGDANVAGLLGPIVCAVSPQGELYVGNIRDSGWGAGNNIGEIVRITLDEAKLPSGIREVKAASDGFTIEFIKPVDPQKAGDPANYSIASYRRESTPAYGGPDLDRRTEELGEIAVSDDNLQVRVKLPNLRKGFVYEFRLKNLAVGRGEFFPAEAHYTLHQTP